VLQLRSEFDHGSFQTALVRLDSDLGMAANAGPSTNSRAVATSASSAPGSSEVVAAAAVAVLPSHSSCAMAALRIEIADLKKDNARLHRFSERKSATLRSVRSQVRHLENQMAKKARTPSRPSPTAVVPHKGGAHYTLRGGLMAASKRCLSNCSAVGYGLAVGEDVDKKTICKYEARLSLPFAILMPPTAT
jgi:hypothetical protein